MKDLLQNLWKGGREKPRRSRSSTILPPLSRWKRWAGVGDKICVAEIAVESPNSHRIRQISGWNMHTKVKIYKVASSQLVHTTSQSSSLPSNANNQTTHHVQNSTQTIKPSRLPPHFVPNGWCASLSAMSGYGMEVTTQNSSMADCSIL